MFIFVFVRHIASLLTVRFASNLRLRSSVNTTIHNKKVLLRERKRHTARRVVSTPSVVLSRLTPPRPADPPLRLTDLTPPPPADPPPLWLTDLTPPTS